MPPSAKTRAKSAKRAPSAKIVGGRARTVKIGRGKRAPSAKIVKGGGTTVQQRRLRTASVKGRGAIKPGCSNVRKYIGKHDGTKYCGDCANGPSYPIKSAAQYRSALARAHDAQGNSDFIRRCAHHLAFSSGWVSRAQLKDNWHDSFLTPWRQEMYNGAANSK